MNTGLLDCITTPKQGNKIPPHAMVIADNGCGPGKDGKQGKGYPGDAKFDAWLLTLPAERVRFAVAPDVVGDAIATELRSLPWLARIRDLGMPAALVAQDGLEDLTIPWDAFDVLFVGGTTGWKLGNTARAIVAEAKRRGKWVHMGRVNSAKRIEYARAIGCDSVDGTYIAFGPDVNLPKVKGWLHALEGQFNFWTTS
jgi:hypothetical protein